MLAAVVLPAVVVWPRAAAAGGQEGSSQLATINLQESSVVRGEWIRLGDVAEIESPAEKVRTALAEVKVGQAPLPGRSRRLSLGSILVHLRRDGWDPDQLVFAGDVRQLEVIRAAGSGAVWVAARDLPRGAVLVEGDLRVEERPLVAGQSWLGADRNPAGWRVIREVAAGSPVPVDAVEQVPLIAVGERVLLVAWVGSIRVGVAGVATTPGGLGDRITVQNLRSGKLITGSVVGPGRVEVEVHL